MKVAIIGAGAGGLAAARHCSDPKFGFHCEVFEQTNNIGGTWIYTDETGVDRDGLPIHTSMYKGLRTNLPKEIMNFPDFEFPENEQSFITQEEVLDYLNNYADKYHLHQYIQFHHQVKHVVTKENNRWLITIKNLLTKNITQKEYDAILICNGHFSKPNIPDIPGKELFKGKLIHSHEYRNSKNYQNEKVLVLGAGASGKDIALHLAQDASKVFLSHRRKTLITPDIVKFPDNIEQVKSAIQFTENSAILTDNTTLLVDSIIYCTGYKYHYSFLSDECNITVDDNWVKPLYKHFINIERPTMAIIGVPFLVCPFPLFDYQVRVFLKSLQGSIKLPKREEMIQDTENEMNEKWSKKYSKKHAHALGRDYQEQHFADLAKLGNLEPLPPVFLKIYGEISGKIRRHLRFKIVDQDNYILL